MLYTALTVRAMRVAYAAHHGQVDKSGVPYVFHPYHLAESMPDEASVCVALLHDVVEDTRVTIGDLERDFPKEVTEAVRLLTHEPGVDYFDYVRTIRANPLAVRVKLADIEHNADQSRLDAVEDLDASDASDASEAVGQSGFPKAVDAAGHERLRRKYARARAILTGVED